MGKINNSHVLCFWVHEWRTATGAQEPHFFNKPAPRYTGRLATSFLPEYLWVHPRLTEQKGAQKVPGFRFHNRKCSKLKLAILLNGITECHPGGYNILITFKL